MVKDQFVEDAVPQKSDAKASRLSIDLAPLSDKLDSRYALDESYTPGDSSDPKKCKTIIDMIECLRKNPNVELDAKVLHYNPANKTMAPRKMNRESFMSALDKNNTRFQESDWFASDGSAGPNSGLVGDDFIPIMGGPFFKQLYYYDFQRMHQTAFWAYNHDPFAHRGVHIMTDFTLGGGFRCDFKNSKHDALWEAFCEANNLYEQFDDFARELSIYGESMWWWLPDNQTTIRIRPSPGQEERKGIIPRIRLMDPSLFWDIITWPEDITQPLAYQWVSPTQYQTYTHVDATGQSVPTSKFIYQQIPADQIIHTKVNCVSNEKRGRSDLFSVLGYFKRLRDSINYSIIGMQKTSAWSIDTSIEGSPADIDAYIQSQQEIGTIAPAASEFVHTSKITRQYLSNQATRSGGEPSAFVWNLNMIAAGMGIPVSYWGTHLSGGQTRASAAIGVEPVTKVFEKRQIVYERVLRKIIKHFFTTNSENEYQVEITFPELVTQDRSAKLKDLALAESQKWVSPKRAGTMASKEFSANDYDWEQEQKDIEAQQAQEPAIAPLSPLTKPGLNSDVNPAVKPSGVTGDDKAKIKKGDKYAN